MKRLLILAFLLLAVTGLAQNVRVGPIPFPSVSSTAPPYLVANLPPNAPVLAVCASPANAVPCTNYVTTYTGGGTACPNGAQDTPDPNSLTSACQSTGDAQGNIGFWIPTGKYDYTVCIQTTCLGPYTITVGSGGSSSFSLTTTAPLTGCSSPCTSTATIGAASSGSGNPTLDNCTPDQTGNSFPSVTSLTNYFLSSWAFAFGTTTYINCTVYVPAAQSGATVVVDVWSSDATAGHTALITYADGVINSGTMNIGPPTSAANQTFTTTSTANNRVTLTFNVQSTLSNGSILVVKIGTTPTGTAPTANIEVYPHFVL